MENLFPDIHFLTTVSRTLVPPNTMMTYLTAK